MKKAKLKQPPKVKCRDCERLFASKYALKRHICPKDSVMGLAFAKVGL